MSPRIVVALDSPIRAADAVYLQGYPRVRGECHTEESPMYRSSNRVMLTCAGLATTTFAAICAPARAATPEQVNAAIDKGKVWLYKQMKNGNNWETAQAPDPKGGVADPAGKQWGGLSAMACYALLAAGENPQSPAFAPAIKFASEAKIEGNYALGLRCQMWPFLARQFANQKGPNSNSVARTAFQARLKADMEQLMRGVYKKDANAGFYAYWNDAKGPGIPPQYDLSISQYGVLGMWACEEAGAEIDSKYWQLVDAAWKNAQKKVGGESGGWPYLPNGGEAGKARTTMTAAGVATLHITQDYLMQQMNWSVCKGGIPNPFIDAGLAYMDRHAAELLTGGDLSLTRFYGMYGIERIGVASGRKSFGNLDWFQTGADFLLSRQDASGCIGGDHINHVFSMLFLIRGRAPVMMNKLEYELTDPKFKAISKPWNERPRDVPNLAAWAWRVTEHYLNWQVVNLNGPVDALHDAPILYITGALPLNFSPEHLAKLRSFVEGGGLILCNADCGNDAFSRSIFARPGLTGAPAVKAAENTLAHKLFPKYEARELPANHPIYINQQFHADKWRQKPGVIGVNNGVRELILLIPEMDPSRAWQTRADKTKEEAFQLGQNIFLYASDKADLLSRRPDYIVQRDPNVQPTKTLHVARIMIGDNPDPEPAGWSRLSNILHNTFKLDLKVDPVQLATGALAGDFKLAHVTGTTRFTLNAEQQKELKDFVARGGTLVTDAAGGSAEFANAADAALAEIFGVQPSAAGNVLTMTDPLYNLPGAKIEQVTYRNWVRGRMAGQLNAPRVRGIPQGNRTAVFVSREDLSAGLVGEEIDGILGYAPASATAIMRNICLYAVTPAAAPASQPATRPTAPQPQTLPAAARAGA